MKSWKIILPSLIATSSLPLVSLVSCGKTTLLLNEWNGSTSCLESKFRQMGTGESYDFSISVKDWPMSHEADFYYYFALYLDNGSGGHIPFKFKKDESLKIYVDNEQLTSTEWTYSDGACLFTDQEVIQRMLSAKKITGSFTIDGPEKYTSFLHVCYYGDWHVRTMEIKQTNGEDFPTSISVGQQITVAAYYKGEILKDSHFFSELPAATVAPGKNLGEYIITGVEVGEARIKCMVALYGDEIREFNVTSQE